MGMILVVGLLVGFISFLLLDRMLISLGWVTLNLTIFRK